jgi:hypothetical protein
MLESLRAFDFNAAADPMKAVPMNRRYFEYEGDEEIFNDKTLPVFRETRTEE